MSAKSFYDLDYIIELNEGRLKENVEQYDKSLGRFTNVLVIYSGITIFLVPTIQDILSAKITSWAFYIAIAVFTALLAVSLYFTVRLLIPVDLAYLVPPQTYYTEYRQRYEQEQPQATPANIDSLIKASYIAELEEAVIAYDIAAERKSSFYSNALRYGLLSILPYIICLAFHFGIKDEQIHKGALQNFAERLSNCNLVNKPRL